MLCVLKERLEQETRGTIDFFLSSDGESIPFGRNWVSSIQDALGRTKICFVFLTPNSTNSSWIYFETGYIYSKEIRVVPVGLPGVDLGKVPPPLGLLQGFNVNSHEGLNNILRILNDEFKTTFQGGFTSKDFDLFLSGSTHGVRSYFKEWGDYVDQISVRVSLKSEVSVGFEKILEGKGVEFSSTPLNGYGQPTTQITTYGVQLLYSSKSSAPSFYIQISSDAASETLGLIDELLSAGEVQPPFELKLRFAQSLNLLSPSFKVSSRFQHTPITIAKDGGYSYQDVQFELAEPSDGNTGGHRFRSFPHGPEIHAKFTGKLGDARLFNLVELLVKRGVVFQKNLSLDDFV